ncbi:14798_t:CDS:2, partial [Dentiscutata heterogama]
NFDKFVQTFEATFKNSDKVRTAANRIQKLTNNPNRYQVMLLNLYDDIKDLLFIIADPTSIDDAIKNAVRYTNQTQAPEPMQIDFVRPKTLSEKEKRQYRINNLNIPTTLLSVGTAEALIFTITLQFQNRTSVTTIALLDSGASSCFLDTFLAQNYFIPMVEKPIPLLVEVINRREDAFGTVTHETEPPAALVTKSSRDYLFQFYVFSPLQGYSG